MRLSLLRYVMGSNVGPATTVMPKNASHMR